MGCVVLACLWPNAHADGIICSTVRRRAVECSAVQPCTVYRVPCTVYRVCVMLCTLHCSFVIASCANFELKRIDINFHGISQSIYFQGIRYIFGYSPITQNTSISHTPECHGANGNIFYLSGHVFAIPWSSRWWSSIVGPVQLDQREWERPEALATVCTIYTKHTKHVWYGLL